MSAVEKDSPYPEPPAMRAARAMIDAGFRPVPITPGKKKPIGADWALIRHHPEKWRDEAVGIGIILGDDGSGRGLIDLEVDDPIRARPTLDRMFPDGISATACFQANLGMHYTFLYDPRLAKYGQTIIKGEVDRKTGKVSGNRHYLGIEIRVGTIDPAKPVQMQSIVPPTPRTDGSAREWIAPDGEVLSPETLFAQAGRFILPLPECIFADLDRYANAAEAEAETEPELTWDKEDVKAAILPHALSLAKEWGLRVTGNRPTAKGFIECRAIDRTDSEPSCGFNPTTGVYTDRKTGHDLSLFNLGLALKVAPDFNSLVNMLGRRFGVRPKAAEGSFVSSGSSVKYSQEKKPQEDAPWKPPRLRDPTPAVPFPLDVLPIGLADLCRAGAVSFQCPPDYFAAAAVALAGAAIGMSVNLALKSDFVVRPHLYMNIVGPPGSKKSPALYFMAAPLLEIDRELEEQYQREKIAHDADLAEHAAARKRGDAGLPPSPPLRHQLTLDDVTREAVAQIHGENPRGLIVIRDELIGWVKAMNAYKQGGKGDDLQFWLSNNSGTPIKVNRKGGDRQPIIVGRPCAAVLGGLTPAMLPAVRANSSADDGFVDRLMFAYPEPIEPDGWNEEIISPDLREEWSAAVRHLWSRGMVVDPDTGRHRPWLIHLTGDARPHWINWFNAHQAEPKHPDFPSSLRGPWVKLESFAGRLVLILSQLHQAYDPESAGQSPVDADALTTWGATRLAEYFKAHYKRTLRDLSPSSWCVPDDCRALIKWLRFTGRDSFSERDAKRNFVGRFKNDPLAFSDVTEWLIRHDCIREVPQERKPGRPHSAVFSVNPYLLDPQFGDSDDSPEDFEV